MSVRTRLVLALGLVAVLLVGPAIYGIVHLREVRDIALELQGRDAAASVAVGRLEAALGQLDWSERSYIAVQGEASRRGMYAALDSARGAVRDLRRAGFEREVAPIDALLTVLGRSAARTEALVRPGHTSVATEEFQGLKPLFDRARASLPPLAEAIDGRAGAAAEQARRLSASAARGTLVALLVAIALALVAGSWLTGSLTVPIRQLGLATRRVARGEFEPPEDLPYDRTDELGELSRSFRAMTRQLDELVRLRAEFVSMASHELKTPLQVVAGYSDMLAAGEYGSLSDAQVEAVRRIREQASILDRFVTQLLDLSRLEAGAFAIELEPISVGQLLDALRRTFEPLAAQRGIRFTIAADSGTPALIDGDLDRLRNEVLGNLLSNAFKFTSRGGSVSVRARGEGDAIAIEVTDTGAGIAREDLPNVFEKYYQRSETGRALGTGLGLAIAREVVLAHGGGIEVASTPGHGSRFVVTLPLPDPGRSTRSPDPIGSAPPPGSGRNTRAPAPPEPARAPDPGPGLQGRAAGSRSRNGRAEGSDTPVGGNG